LGKFQQLSGKKNLEIKLKEPATIRDVVVKLEKTLSNDFNQFLVDSQLNDPRPNTLILVSGKEISALQGLETEVKDSEEIIEAALRSVARQDFPHDLLELIVVDDGSSDHSWDMICECAAGQKRLVTIRNGKNIGLSASLNKGLHVAQGRYVARQDADDMSSPKRLERQVAYLAKHTDVGLLGTAYDVIDSKGHSVEMHRQPSSDTEIRWQMLFYNAFCHSSVMFRRSSMMRSLSSAAFSKSRFLAASFICDSSSLTSRAISSLAVGAAS